MQKSSVTFIAILSVIALGGCATSYTPPQAYDKEIQRQFGHSYQVSWDAVLDLVTATGYKLDQVSKDSGYLSIARRLTLNNDEADCGKFFSGGAVHIHTSTPTANVAVRFKTLPGNRSQVSVVVTATHRITGTSVWDGSYFERVYVCESTGKLERTVLDSVSNYKE